MGETANRLEIPDVACVVPSQASECSIRSPNVSELKMIEFAINSPDALGMVSTNHSTAGSIRQLLGTAKVALDEPTSFRIDGQDSQVGTVACTITLSDQRIPALLILQGDWGVWRLDGITIGREQDPPQSATTA